MALHAESLERSVLRALSGEPRWIDTPRGLRGLHASWTDCTFSSRVWEARHVSPADQYPVRIDFGRMARKWRAFSKVFLILVEHPIRLGRGDRPVRSPSRFYRSFAELLLLTEFMEREGLIAFCELSPQHVTRFLEEWASTPRRADCTDRGVSSYRMMLATMQRLYHLGPSGLGILPDGLVFRPEEIRNPADLGFRVAPAGTTPELPEVVAHKLWQSAYQWLERMGPVLVEALPILEAHKRFSGPPLPASAARRGRDALLAQPEYLTLIRGIVARLPFGVHQVLRQKGASQSGSMDPEQLFLQRPVQAMTALLDLTLVAGYIVMAMLSGFRIGEVLTVKCGGLFTQATGWKVRSVVSKTSPKEKGYETDRPVPLGFAEAHEALVQLAAARGLNTPEAPLFVGAGGKVPGRFRINTLINTFARLHSIEWHFASHQFRKFFALFYVRRFRGPIDALRWHFRHISREMIEAYIKDALNARYLAEAEAELMEEILSSIIHGDGGYALPPPVSRYVDFAGRYRALNLPLQEVEEVLRKGGPVSGLKIMPMEWGYCVEARACKGTAPCQGAHGIKRRDVAVPSDCFACPFLIVGQENVARVTQSLLFHRDVLNDPTPAQIAKRHSAMVVARMEAVLAKLQNGGSDHRRIHGRQAQDGR